MCISLSYSWYYNTGQAKPTPRISCFSQELWFLFSENDVRNQDLDVPIATGVYLLLGPFR